ncbi:MAG: hypothetical protein IKS03_02645, partial [Ruminococcus sp.]|nr:hypothetical protein [Ruminococcus sp.]
PSLKTLTLKKKLFDKDGNVVLYPDDKTEFSFRLYLTNEIDTDDFKAANMRPYYVKDTSGHLCTWNADEQKFDSTEYSDYDVITDEDEKKTVTFETSMNGAISKIPAGYTVEVPGLIIGTKFKVVEKESEVPLGYKWLRYDLKYTHLLPEVSETTLTKETGQDEGITGDININDSSIDVETVNKRGYGLEAKKIWSDEAFTESHANIYTAVYKVSRTTAQDGTVTITPTSLVPNTVKTIKHPDTSVRYYFDSLDTGTKINDYQIFEVELVNPVTDSEGNLISYSGNPATVPNGSFNNVIATPNKSGTEQLFSYKAEYDLGDPKYTADNSNGNDFENVRSDKITNTRSGGIVITLYDKKETTSSTDLFNKNNHDPLPNGVFVLTDADGNKIGEFTSDRTGRVTIMYDFVEDVNYVLEQKKTPDSYIGLPNKITFSVQSNNVIINGANDNWIKAQKSETDDQLVAYIDVFNKQFSLKAFKVNEKGEKLGGAKFELYRGVEGIGGDIVRDRYPMTFSDGTNNYTELISSSEEGVNKGIIPKIGNSLEEGTYFLKETKPLNGYIPLTKDIEFRIEEDDIVLVSTGTSATSGEPEAALTKRDDNGEYICEITVKNQPDKRNYYFDIEKIVFADENIHSTDSEQKFVFKIERFEENTTDFTVNPEEVFYVTLNCDKNMTYTYNNSTMENIKLDSEDYPYSLDINDYTNHSFDKQNKKVTINYSNTSYTFPAAILNGRKTIHVQKEGIYRISEVSNNSKTTDYDFWTGSNIYKGYGDGSKGENIIIGGFRDSTSTGDNLLSNDEKDCVYINVSEVKADRFESLSASIDNKDVYRPTASFINSETECAYLSSQAYAENVIKRKNS